MNLLLRVKNILNTAPHRASRERKFATGFVAVATPFLFLAINGIPMTQNLAIAQEREGARSAEAEAGQRESVERDGQRRSAEAEKGPRRSAEAEEGARRSAEGERGARRSPEAEGRGEEGNNPLRGFKPQTKREQALFQMIVQLQREVDALRKEVRSRDRGEQTEQRNKGLRSEGDVSRGTKQFDLPANWERTKEGRVFKAYDKNSDNIVSLDEWLAMTNGNISPARREISTKHFNDAEPSGDGKFTPAEFIWWRQVGSKQAAERANRNRSREGEGVRRGPRDGEGNQSGPRERE